MGLPTHIVDIGGVVINDNDEILLVKNPRKGWEFPGR
ncbi:ADP-ribose pyrophosphatase YjhB (NUDIX family) [Hathewaya limosa]|uniref:ADP-ribose pyrophosphatase YjhB (NUDIX family) n=1 Tax=Hathewaya limosa TaxID=1536 RepID=A0ABU0JVE5_HATLI|nr:ADP-ribose pyrophosphatase YjhB (NUDIX family) [Hathewaya limosa]